jgi:trk system potassium uptake protein
LLIYVSLTLLEVFFLLLGRMSLFDSICHAFGTLATGGFSTHNNSLADFSPYIQYIVMIFMLLAGINFTVYYYAFKREFKKVKSNEELKFYLKTILILGGILTALLFFNSDKSLEVSFREGFFQLISIVTCTGFATTDYLLWPNFIWILLFFAMFLGGCTGSTAGGVKMARYLILLKNIQKIIRQLFSPNAVIPIRLNNNVVGMEMNTSILSFISIYFFIVFIGSLTLIILGIDASTATSSVATCMAGIGPGIGNVGPMNNFAHFSPLIKIILSFIMLAGRLEIYTILLLFTPSFWRNI